MGASNVQLRQLDRATLCGEDTLREAPRLEARITCRGGEFRVQDRSLAGAEHLIQPPPPHPTAPPQPARPSCIEDSSNTAEPRPSTPHPNSRRISHRRTGQAPEAHRTRAACGCQVSGCSAQRVTGRAAATRSSSTSPARPSRSAPRRCSASGFTSPPAVHQSQRVAG